MQVAVPTTGDSTSPRNRGRFLLRKVLSDFCPLIIQPASLCHSPSYKMVTTFPQGNSAAPLEEKHQERPWGSTVLGPGTNLVNGCVCCYSQGAEQMSDAMEDTRAIVPLLPTG